VPATRGLMVFMRRYRQVQTRVLRGSSEKEAKGWIEDEVAGCRFEDGRYSKRLRQLLEQFSERVGATMPLASQN
jgi:hypothetical protein